MAWESGIASEISFWETWAKEKGSQWPEDYAFRFNPLSEESAFANYLRQYEKPRILDVGAGPVTRLGKVLDGNRLDITAVDALADLYDKIPFEMERPIPTLQCKTEDLDKLFEPYSFDAVFAFNTLDHSFDPILALSQMLRVTKQGGIIITQHYENEATHENWQGMHQFNFYTREDKFYISNREATIDVIEYFGSDIEVLECSGSEHRACYFYARKLK